MIRHSHPALNQASTQESRIGLQPVDNLRNTQPKAAAKTSSKKTTKAKWPKSLPEQVTAIYTLTSTIGPDPEALDLTFGRAHKKRRAQIEQILATLKALGQI